MSVPNYNELGKDAQDVFRTGYAYDLAKFKFSSNLGVEGSAAVDLRAAKITGLILGKYKLHHGVLTAKLSTPGLLVGEYSLNGVISENVDIEVGYSNNLADKFQSFRVLGKFHNSIAHVTSSLTKDLDGDATLHGTAVLKLGNFLLGYQAELKPDGSRLSKNDLAFGCELGDAAFLHLRCLMINKEIGLSTYYKVSEKVNVAMDAKIGLVDDSKPWFAGIGMTYFLEDNSKLRVKIDKNLQLGSSLQLPLKNHAKLILAMSLDMPKITSGQHKIGIGLELEA